MDKFFIKLLSVLTLIGIGTFWVPFFMVGVPYIDFKIHAVESTGLILYTDGFMHDTVDCNRDRDILDALQNRWLNSATSYDNVGMQVTFGDIRKNIFSRSVRGACDCDLALNTRDGNVVSTSVKNECAIKDLPKRNWSTLFFIIFLGGCFGLFIFPPFIMLGMFSYYGIAGLHERWKKWRDSKEIVDIKLVQCNDIKV